ncbi:hypothetical protein C1X46_00005, partial [Pseudomonas sp. FW306-07-L]
MESLRTSARTGRLSGCLRGQAALLQGVRCTRFALHHSSGRALARLQLGRHRWQASSHRVRCSPASHWSAVRPPSRASLAPTRIQRTAFDF